MPQFDSGAAEPIGRFSEGLLLRLLHLGIIFRKYTVSGSFPLHKRLS